MLKRVQMLDLVMRVMKKKAPFCCFRGFVGDETLPSYFGIIINHYKDPVIKQPGFNGK